MEESGVANNVAHAISVALDWSCSVDAKKAALSFLESFKTGDVHVFASTSFMLLKKEWPSEIRLHAFKMLQHLVRLRWGELSLSENRSFSNHAINFLSEVAEPNEAWALRSQAAALVAEIVKKDGQNLREELLPSLMPLCNAGPVQAEIVAMVFRWLPEDITVHNEGLEGDRRRLLLREITRSLPEILRILYTFLGRHFEVAMDELGKQHVDVARQHASAVVSTLNAMKVYAEWAPLDDLAKSGIIYGCGCLLSSPDFRLHACEFFKLVSQRKIRSIDLCSESTSAMTNVLQVLMNATNDFLHKSSSINTVDERELECASYICEAMTSLGTTNLHSISASSTDRSAYLRQMLGYFRHFKMALHLEALPFWTVVMRDLVSSGQKHAPSQAKKLEAQKKKSADSVDDDTCKVILDVSLQRLLGRDKLPFTATSASEGNLELWGDDDIEGKGDFSQYHSKLLELIRLVACAKPFLTSTTVSESIFLIVRDFPAGQIPSREIAVLESLQAPLEISLAAAFDPHHQSIHSSLSRVFEALLHQLLPLKWTDPILTELLGHYLESFGPFLKHCPGAVQSVINKFFELLTSLPQDPSGNTRHARLRVCSSVVSIAAKAADSSLLPHLKEIAETMAYMEDKGTLLRAEWNILGEACLVIAAAAGCDHRKQVLEWLLEPLRKHWARSEWQNLYLSEPSGVIRLCADRNFMWWIFHTVSFFERALKRSGIKNHTSPQNALPPDPHPISPHLSWMLPPLLNLLRAIHSLWSPPVLLALPVEMKAAMAMNECERHLLLGDSIPKSQKPSSPGFADVKFDQNDVHNWLRGVRDSGYNVVGLASTIGLPFFQCLDPESTALSLLGNVQGMEFRHVRQIIHSVVSPLIRSCPVTVWHSGWLQVILDPLLTHCDRVLALSWSSFSSDGRAGAPDTRGLPAGSDLHAELLEEKLLRDLTRETCSLLSLVASAPLNPRLPLSDHPPRVDPLSLQPPDHYTPDCMISFVLSNSRLAVPALTIASSVLTWTDGEAVAKVTSFCSAVVLVAGLTAASELHGFIARNLFCAAVQGMGIESNAVIASDLVGLCRDIFVSLVDRDPSPRQVLLSLPGITADDLLAFEDGLRRAAGVREQKQILRSLLLHASGSSMKALFVPKAAHPIVNVSAVRVDTLERHPEPALGSEYPLGLAGL